MYLFDSDNIDFCLLCFTGVGIKSKSILNRLKNIIYLFDSFYRFLFTMIIYRCGQCTAHLDGRNLKLSVYPMSRFMVW